MKVLVFICLFLAGCKLNQQIESESVKRPQTLLKLEDCGGYVCDVSENSLPIVQNDVYIPSGNEFYFNGKNSVLSVDDSFLDGEWELELSFYFILDRYETMENATLVCSNFAYGNQGDWLLQFDNGRLMLLIQTPGELRAFGSKRDYEPERKYYIKLVKTETHVLVYVNDILDIQLAYSDSYNAQGAPLVFGSNHYDRDGMYYFTGLIGEIEVRK